MSQYLKQRDNLNLGKVVRCGFQFVMTSWTCILMSCSNISSHTVPLCDCTFKQEVLYVLWFWNTAVALFLLRCWSHSPVCCLVLASSVRSVTARWPAVFSQPSLSYRLFTDWTFPVPLCQASRRLLWLRAANLKWPTAAVTVSFSETIYKAPVPFCCRPSLGFPLQPLPAPSHRPFQLMAFYLPAIWLLCLSLAAWQSAESGTEGRAECLGCSWLLLWLQNGTTTCWISDVQSARQ